MYQLPIHIGRSARFAASAYLEQLQDGSDCVRFDGSYDGQAWVLRPTDHEVVVTFRGSESIMDWCMNFLRYKVRFPGIAGSRVHAGFYKQYSALKEMVLSAVSTYVSSNDVSRVLVTGHSLGGSLATMFAVDLAQKYPDLPVICHTFCAPRIGDRTFVHGLEYIANLRLLRVYNPSDIITWIPYFGFHHAGETYVVRSPGPKWYQFKRKHSLDQFFSAL